MREAPLVMLVFVASFSTAQGQSGNMAGMDMSHASGQTQGQDTHDMSGMGGDGSAMAMHSMEGRHMDMGPHMKMTAVRPIQPGDQAKAAQNGQASRTAAEKNT